MEELAARLCAAANWCTLASRPGYVESLKSRRRVRLLLLPAVGLATLVADAIRPGGVVEGALEVDVFVLLALLGAGVAPVASDTLVAAAAVLHTWHGSTRAAAAPGGDPRVVLAAEYLVMFWMVALPMLAGTNWCAVVAYCAAVLGLWLPTAQPGTSASGFVTALLLMVPLLAAELHLSERGESLVRTTRALKQVLAGLGGTTCSVQTSSGTVLEVSPELRDILGSQGACGEQLVGLVRLPQEQESLRQLIHAAALLGTDRGSGDDALFSAGLNPIEVTSFQASGAGRGRNARLIPFELSAVNKTLKFLVEVKAPKDAGEAELAARERRVVELEESLLARQQALNAREGHAKELEAALEELHGLYEAGCRVLESDGRPTPCGSSGNSPRPPADQIPESSTACDSSSTTARHTQAEDESMQGESWSGSSKGSTHPVSSKESRAQVASSASVPTPRSFTPRSSRPAPALGTRDGSTSRTGATAMRRPESNGALRKARDLLRSLRQEEAALQSPASGTPPSRTASPEVLGVAKVTVVPPLNTQSLSGKLSARQERGRAALAAFQAQSPSPMVVRLDEGAALLRKPPVSARSSPASRPQFRERASSSAALGGKVSRSGPFDSDVAAHSQRDGQRLWKSAVIPATRPPRLSVGGNECQSPAALKRGER